VRSGPRCVRRSEPLPCELPPDPEPKAPTIDQLREQATELGIPGPPPTKAERMRARVREQVFSLLTFTDAG
jgi:hypothetical protein